MKWYLKVSMNLKIEHSILACQTKDTALLSLDYPLQQALLILSKSHNIDKKYHAKKKIHINYRK